MSKTAIQVGIIGLGTVGCGTLRVLEENAANINHRLGVPLIIKKLANRHLHHERLAHLPRSLLTTDGWEIVNDPEIDIVVETIGGVGAAKDFVFGAVRNGKNVVTANKELIARYGRELLAEARERQVDVYFEGSVAGGIPIIQPLKQSLIANRITRIVGIVNGTTNYILTRMKRDHLDFAASLAEAQAAGYAEPDPTNDVDGHDPAYKIAILAAIAFDSHVDMDQVYREGIRRICPEDLRYADELGYEIKLLAVARDDEEAMEIRVHPALVSQQHPLASVHDVFNAIFVHGDAVDDLMFYGRGAGAGPTGSAVVGDLLEVARNVLYGSTGRLHCTCSQDKPIRPIEEVASRFYIRMWVADRPGVLAAVAGILGQEGVSVASMVQKETSTDQAEIVWITHRVVERKLRQALQQIVHLDCVHQVSNVIRVEDLD
jgi:homoserine dehydrogenase